MERPQGKPSDTEGGFTPFGEFSMQTEGDRRSFTIGRRLRGDFSDVDPNVMRIATVCMGSIFGAIGLTGMYVGLSMVDNAIRDIPAKYIDIVTKAAMGGVLTMGASMGAFILIIKTLPYWSRK